MDIIDSINRETKKKIFITNINTIIVDSGIIVINDKEGLRVFKDKIEENGYKSNIKEVHLNSDYNYPIHVCLRYSIDMSPSTGEPFSINVYIYDNEHLKLNQKLYSNSIYNLKDIIKTWI